MVQLLLTRIVYRTACAVVRPIARLGRSLTQGVAAETSDLRFAPQHVCFKTAVE